MRALLKERTSETHRRLDDAFGELDLTTFYGYALFLSAHQRAYAALEASGVTETALRATLETVHDLLKRDLATLGVAIAAPQRADVGARVHPLGTHYVLAGSHFGKRVLLKRWSRSTDQRVLSSAHYLKGEGLREDWPAVLAALSEVDADKATADAIIDGALSTFTLFGKSLNDAATAEMEPRFEPA